MKASNVKALVAMSEFFTYITTPEELSQILKRVYDLEDTTRDRMILNNLSRELEKALAK